ncbi:ankyrin repeat-containing domain protein [Biscogniauxia marginata]|nr:ankyrin repeat-containing domain protein [Biscogniauxia marginata]
MDRLTALPDELILAVIDECNSRGIAALTASNRRLWHIAGRALYERNISEDNSSALLWAVDRGRFDTINYLFAIRRANGEIRANVDTYGTGGMFGEEWRAIELSDLLPYQRFCTPLHIAVSQGELGMIDLLLRHGADIDGTSNRFCQCQYYGTGYNHHGLVFPPDAEPWTPLHTALCCGQQEAALLLISRGANLLVRRDEPGGRGITALHIAAARGMSQVVRLLVEKHFPVDVVDSSAITPMVYAARNGHGCHTTMPLLRQLGADINVEVSNAGLRCSVPLLLNLIHAGMYAEARQAIDLGADIAVSVPAGASRGHTALHLCCYAQKAIAPDKYGAWKALLSRLLRDGLAADARGADGRAPLHFAVTMGTPAAAHAINTLVDAGADVNARNNRGETPLISYCSECVEQNGFSRIGLLIERGASVNVADNEGWTPLARVCASELESSSYEAALTLLRHGADPHAMVNVRGAQVSRRSILALCLQKRAPRLVALVMRYGGRLHKDEDPTNELQGIFEELAPRLTRIQARAQETMPGYERYRARPGGDFTFEQVAFADTSLPAAVLQLMYGVSRLLNLD